MLTKEKKSRLLLIRIRHRRMSLTIPVALYIFEDLLRSFRELFLLGEKVFPGKNKFIPSAVMELSLYAYQELIRHGRWEMVNIEVEKTRVLIEFY